MLHSIPELRLIRNDDGVSLDRHGARSLACAKPALGARSNLVLGSDIHLAALLHLAQAVLKGAGHQGLVVGGGGCFGPIPTDWGPRNDVAGSG